MRILLPIHIVAGSLGLVAGFVALYAAKGAALLTAYLVVTALTTVRASSAATRRLEQGGMLLASAVGLTVLTFGFAAIAHGGTWLGMPVYPFFLFGAIGVLSSIGDLRRLRAAPPSGASRIGRHLWRMSLALFVAALSFFIGQAKVIPRPIRIMPLLVLPPLAVLATMLYWLWRVRVRRILRWPAGVGRQEAA